MKSLKQTVMQEASSSIWDLHFTDWENILKVLVCPDIIRKIIPELTSIISKTEQIARGYFFVYNRIRIKIVTGGTSK